MKKIFYILLVTLTYAISSGANPSGFVCPLYFMDGGKTFQVPNSGGRVQIYFSGFDPGAGLGRNPSDQQIINVFNNYLGGSSGYSGCSWIRAVDVTRYDTESGLVTLEAQRGSQRVAYGHFYDPALPYWFRILQDDSRPERLNNRIDTSLPRPRMPDLQYSYSNLTKPETEGKYLVAGAQGGYFTMDLELNPGFLWNEADEIKIYNAITDSLSFEHAWRSPDTPDWIEVVDVICTANINTVTYNVLPNYGEARVATGYDAYGSAQIMIYQQTAVPPAQNIFTFISPIGGYEQRKVFEIDNYGGTFSLPLTGPMNNASVNSTDQKIIDAANSYIQDYNDDWYTYCDWIRAVSVVRSTDPVNVVFQVEPNPWPRGRAALGYDVSRIWLDSIPPILIIMQSGEEEVELPDPLPHYPAPPRSVSPTAGTNWTYRKTFLSESGRQYASEITYFNGVGLPEQSVRAAVTEAGKSDLITPFYYDNKFRESLTYLPYAYYPEGLVNGKKDPDQFGTQYEYYRNTYGHAEGVAANIVNVFESAPEGRLKSSVKPGAIYRTDGRSTDYVHSFNDENELFKISVDEISGSLNVNGYYPANSLFKTTVADEDGGTVTVFTDGSDRTLLERRSLSTHEFADTYYVYDGQDRLSWVISPEGSEGLHGPVTLEPESGEAKDWCYLYRYDGRGRVTAKRLPGSDWTYMVYDTGDELVMLQDANLREQDRWITYEYDALKRLTRKKVSRTGLGTRTVLQDAVNTAAGYVRSVGEYTIELYGYGEEPPAELHFVVIPGVIAEDDLDTRTGGLLTYEQYAVLAGSEFDVQPDMVSRATYYDTRGRVSQTVTRNHLGGVSRHSFSYDFTGNILTSHQMHNPGTGQPTDTLVTVYRYDKWGKVLSERTTLNSGEPSFVAYSYNDLEQLADKTYGAGDEKLTAHFDYNLQGWLTEQGNDLFDMKLRYYDPVKGTEGSFTGNITEWEWSHKGGDAGHIPSSAYAFTYDGLDRLTDSRRYEGMAATPVDKFTESGLSYDLNGNIKTLRRYGQDNIMHDLSYGYDGNRLTTLSNSGLSAPRTHVYTYDANGNMTYDGRQGVGLDYNYLNLVNSVTGQADGEVKARYSWLADGTKLSVTTGDGSSGYEYLGSLVYERRNGQLALESAAFGEGRIVAAQEGSGSTYITNYFLRDHLGSTRVVVDNACNVLSRHDYFPFGLTWPNLEVQTGSNRYLYNGKELQEGASLDYLDYGARMYDAVRGQWPSPDALSEMYFNVSPYSFVGNNPISKIDIHGLYWLETKDSEIADNLYGAGIAMMRRNERKIERLTRKAEKIQNSSKSDATKQAKLDKIESDITLLTFANSELLVMTEGLTNIGNDTETAYTFNATDLSTNVLEMNSEGTIIINYYEGSKGSLAHETLHAVQHQQGLIRFPLPGTRTELVNARSYEALEVPAYRIQFLYQRRSMPTSSNGGRARSVRNITPTWYRGLLQEGGNLIYR